MRFVIVPIWYRKNNLKISDVYILVERALEKLHLHPQGGPNTHDDPHETGASQTPQDPFLCRKTILETIKSLSIFVYYNVVFLHIEIINSCLMK